MAALLAFTRNPMLFERRDFAAVPAGSRPIDWLLEHHPRGCGGPVAHWHNGELIDAEADDWLDRPIAEGDVVVLAVAPGEPISITTIIVTALITAAVSAAVSIGLSLLFPEPTAPIDAVALDSATSNPSYSVRSRQNQARLGEPVPVVYGECLMTPDLIAPANPMFAGPRGMYIDQLMCIGHGEFDVLTVTVGETDAELIEGDAARWIVVPPATHASTFGNLNGLAVAAGWDGGFHENPWMSQEVGQQRFTVASDAGGYFRVGRAGVSEGQFLVISLEWPRGLYSYNASGEQFPGLCEWEVHVTEADADGQPIVGTEMVFEHEQLVSSLDPFRFTYSVDCGYVAAWLVKLVKISGAYGDGFGMNEFYWRGLMLSANHYQSEVYGNVTLLMVRLVAEEIAASADRLVRVRCIRRLAPLGTGALVPTTSPADAFVDMYTNPTYGGRRPLAEVDTARLATLADYWTGYEFNGVWSQSATVWDALTQCLQGVAAAPLPIGSLMSVVQDGIRPARSMLFTEQNIVRRTFELSYQFEQTGEADGIEIEYVDPATWAPAYARYPTASVSPDRANLFGCSDPAHAAQFARLQWQRRQKLRRLVDFQTELEGLIPFPGERVAVAHTLPRWGVSGYVAEVVTGLTIALDRPLPWDDVPGPHYMIFRNEEGGASAIVGATRGADDGLAVLASDPWIDGGGWIIGLRQEGTHFAWGDGARVVRDFTLASLAPKGGAVVSISGVIYDPSVYTGTLTFLADPVP